MSGQANSPDQERYSVFDTPIGPFGIAWSDRGLTRVRLPGADRLETEAQLKTATASRRAEDPPARIKQVIAKVQKYLAGGKVDFSAVAIDLIGVTPFHRKVYEAARSVAWGQTASYGDLARLAGSPAAARAVGQALSRNPIAIIIPCHRILASGNRMGGFSAFGGTTAKECLLALEGVSIGSLPAPVPASSQEGLDPVEAVRVLSAADPALAGVILETGPFMLEPRRGSTPFERLAEAVVHQQLSNAIAATITGRVKNALNGDWTPEALLRADHELLRACGLSQAKANTLRALAEKTVDGTIPGYRSLQRMTDQEIVERLTTVKGVGVWTAQMFLMFSLLRPDVMPATDYGIRRGFQIVVRTPDLPTPAAIEAHAECWRPYRTVASWYLWRAADKSRQKPS